MWTNHIFFGRGDVSTLHHKVNGFDWDCVNDVLLDMDGTLLDRHFDNVFFNEELPKRFAAKHGLPLDQARETLFGHYRAVEGKLAWADLDYWTQTLDIDTVAVTHELRHMIEYHHDAVEFLRYLRSQGKRLTLVTNAHGSSLEIKAVRTGIDQYMDLIVTASEVGSLKMHAEFWSGCQRIVGFDPSRSLYIDDDEASLGAAQQYGVGYLYHRSKSSSRLPPERSTRFLSIESFRELMAP